MYRRRRTRLPIRVRSPLPILIGGSGVNGADQSSYSFSNLAISTPPDAQRTVYAWIFTSASGTTSSDAEPTSCTIGGAVPALVIGWVRTVTNSSGIFLFAANIAGGSTATVSLSFGVPLRRCGCLLASTITPLLVPRVYGVLTASGTSDIAGSVVVPSLGFVGVHNQHNTAVGNAFTFSGAGSSEVVDANIEGGTQMAAATLGVSGTLTITSNNDAGMDAIWMAL